MTEEQQHVLKSFSKFMGEAREISIILVADRDKEMEEKIKKWIKKNEKAFTLTNIKVTCRPSRSLEGTYIEFETKYW